MIVSPGYSTPTASAPGSNDGGGSAYPGIISGSAAIMGAAGQDAGTVIASPAGTASPAVRTATAKSAHEMIVATGIIIVVVYLLVIVAGMSQGAGRAVLAFFGMAILVQGLGHTATVLKFVQSKPLTPKAG